MSEGRKGGRKSLKKTVSVVVPAQRGYRVMVALSEKEYQDLTVWAHKSGLARGAFVRSILTAAKVL